MTTAALKSFSDFDVHPAITEALAAAGITTPFPIQELTLPMALGGADIIGQARTGTGKTLAFGIPLLQHVDPEAAYPQALVIVPTRELCLQVHDDIALAGAGRDVRTVAVYGGRPIEAQEQALADGATVVVGTPGRLLDLTRRGSLTLSKVSSLVLDEADEMLDLGFLPDVEQLIELTGDKRQTLLFSATMPAAIVSLARRYMDKPTFLRADVEEQGVGPETVQYFLSCHRMDKPAVLARILQAPGRGRCLAFTRTKRMADVLAEDLRERGIAASPIHSDLRQEAREKTLERFRAGKVDVLVATEVAARGLDISEVTHVVNYDCPDDEKMYLHRIGRTGRAGAAGVAITLAVWNELARVEMIKRALDVDAPTHEVFSTSPILDELFDLPAGDQRPTRTFTADDRPGKQASRDRGKQGDRPAAKQGDRSAAKQGDRRAAKQGERPASTQRGRTAQSRPRPQTGEAEVDAPEGRRVRVRRRQRSDERTTAPAQATTDEAAGQAAARRQRDDDGQRQSRGQDRRPASTTGEDRRTTTSGDTGGERKTSPSSSDGGKKTGSRTDGQKSGSRSDGQKSGGGGRPRSRSRSGANRSNRSGERQGGGTRDEPSAQPEPARQRADVDQARGEGKPGLDRPFAVSHLP